MAFEREEFQEALEKRDRERANVQRRELRQIAQSEPPMEAMTGSAEWDFFLSILEAQIQEHEKLLMGLRDSRAADPSFAYEDLARYKAEERILCTKIGTLQSVRDLPKEIIEQGDKAKLVLDRYVGE